MSGLNRDSAPLEIEELTIALQKRRVRHLYLRVSLVTGQVRIVAPHWVTSRTIREFAVSRLAWIRGQLARLPPPGSQLLLPLASPPAGRRERELLQSAALAMLPMWETRLGVRCRGLSLRRMRSRWGSCSPHAGTVRLSTELARYPSQCLEYVLVHELVHLLEPTHNRRFRTLMDFYLPDWRARLALLRAPAVAPDAGLRAEAA